MEPGEHQLQVCATRLRLPPKAYIYQLEVQSDAGIFCQYKLFTFPEAAQSQPEAMQVLQAEIHPN